MMVSNCQNHAAQHIQPAVQNNVTTTNNYSCGNGGGTSIGSMFGNANMMLMLLQVIMAMLQQMQGQSQGNEGNQTANNGGTNTNTGGANGGNANAATTGGNPAPNAGNTGGNANVGGTNQPQVVVCELAPQPEPEPVVSAEDQKVMDYVEDRQGTWLAGHGDYEGKSTNQDVYTFKTGPLEGYTAHHVEGGKFDIKNPDGETICQHDSGKDRNKVASPVAFDLNGDNKIGTTGETTAKDRAAGTDMGQTVQFDIDGDGTQDNIEWMNGDGDGLLVDTSKIGADGSIDGNALFGDQGGKFENGYDKMAQHDANGDGKLSGDELNNLGVWVDDGDAVLEEGELRTLGEFDITEMSTQKQDVANDRGETLMRSDATTSNGDKVMTEDVWFGQE